jgi:hypothetical protein
VKAFEMLQNTVQNTVQTTGSQGAGGMRASGVKSEESRQNSHYLEQLGTQIAATSRLLEDIANRETEAVMVAQKPETQARTVRKLQGAAHVCRLLLHLSKTDSSVGKCLMRWRSHKISITTNLVSNDIQKCWKKFNRTLIIVLNRRFLNKVAGHFSHFVRQCVRHGPQQPPSPLDPSSTQRSHALARCLLLLQSPRKTLYHALSLWRARLRSYARQELAGQRGLLRLVPFSFSCRRE